MALRAPVQVTRYLKKANRFEPSVIEPGQADAVASTEAEEDVGAAAVAVSDGMASAAHRSVVRRAKRMSIIGIQS